MSSKVRGRDERFIEFFDGRIVVFIGAKLCLVLLAVRHRKGNKAVTFFRNPSRRLCSPGKTANYPPHSSVLKVTESVALRVPFVTFTVAVTFVSSG
jgi:hypothetical protein